MAGKGRKLDIKECNIAYFVLRGFINYEQWAELFEGDEKWLGNVM